MIEYSEDKNVLTALTLAPQGRNWVEGSFHFWGEAEAPEGVSVSVSREKTAEGRLRETYIFKNETDAPLLLTGAGVWTTFNENYDAAEKCRREKCHAHLWCGGTSSWVCATAMDARPPHLGLILTKGSLETYKVERENNSNDRGDLCLLLSPASLAAGEEYVLSWELFEHRGDDFFDLLKEYPSYLDVSADTFTFFPGEAPRVFIKGTETLLPEEPGYHTVQKDGAFFRYQVLPPPRALALARCRFLAEYQQETEGELAGAYLSYDNETNTRVYEENPNHNAGRERVGMGVLMARTLQASPDPVLHESLSRYADFVLREHFDEATGEVFNELHRDNHRRRIYNNAWYASFFRELYRLEKDKRWLFCMVGALKDLYAHGGKTFYPLALEATDAILCLREAGMTGEEETLLRLFAENAAHILEKGTDYPSIEVRYEDNIVIPAGMLLCQMAELTGERKYRDGALLHLEAHRAFTHFQPDARMHGCSIHHWDDFWFGKRGLYGDTFPHYWSSAGSVFCARMGRLLSDDRLLCEARAGLRSTLSGFFPDGRATCAIVTPASVNGVPGDFIDPWANDQDWALYFALTEEALVLAP